MRINEITQTVLDAAFKVHSRLGPGLLETVYEKVLALELRKRGLRIQCQKTMPIQYDGMIIEDGFRPDMIVEDCVIVELKSVEKLAAVHPKQLLTYLRLADMSVGLLLNFGEARLTDGIERIINSSARPT